ncbi:rossmann fold protein [Grosmannia clavigera kw1407]|uniref:Rossmann fold protein n=1 Tax=Grosmannia clavigera (strain kw1407 / UAMH 11150) TaxID=655863 RepID=F0XEQ3_GROCL|nr:rossmann fold protein [Grosmannia clavigera kw1407]EFX03674.1 rossmann fold protein [Grosmannia clavigera kw1407]
MAAAARPIQVGVIGYGLSARVFQIPFVLACSRLVLRAIVQRHGDEAQRDHPTATIYRDAAALFADAAVDLVIVTTPPVSHVTLASQALAAGKHVVVEKPFAPTAADCDRLLAQARDSGRLLSVYQNRRWDGDFVTLQALMGTTPNPLGRLVEFESHIDRFVPPGRPPHAAWLAESAQPTTGALYEIGSHLLDQAVTLLGLPQHVTGFVAAQRGGNATAPDTFTVLLHYAGGLLATLKSSPASAETEQLRFWVRGERGSYRKYHFDPQETQALEQGLGPGDPGFGVEDPAFAGRLTVYGDDGQLHTSTVPAVSPPPTYTCYYDLLAAAIDGTGPVPVPAEDARNAVRLVELALQSAAEGRTLAWEP